MKNNLNKNKSISNSISNLNNNINNTNKKVSKKKSKKKSKISRENIKIMSNNLSNTFEFPQGEHHKCIGPCYPANTTYYHPITLQQFKNNFSSCPISKSIEINGKKEIYDKCNVNNNANYEGYDIFADVFDLASTDKLFLEQIYKIKNIGDVILFLDNEINELPILSQKRILNSIYKVFRDEDIFPNDNFIVCVQNILKLKFNLNVNTKKIFNIIMKNKHNTIWNDIFEKINDKINS